MSDRITIINNNNGTVDVMLNGVTVQEIPTTNLDTNIHAVQWYGDHGEVEYNDHNKEITDFSEFSAVMEDREAEVDRITNEALESESSEEKNRRERNNILRDTDWIVIKYTEKGESIPQEWSDYRQSLRDITLQDGFPGNVNWPEEPNTSP